MDGMHPKLWWVGWMGPVMSWSQEQKTAPRQKTSAIKREIHNNWWRIDLVLAKLMENSSSHSCNCLYHRYSNILGTRRRRMPLHLTLTRRGVICCWVSQSHSVTLVVTGGTNETMSTRSNVFLVSLLSINWFFVNILYQWWDACMQKHHLWAERGGVIDQVMLHHHSVVFIAHASSMRSRRYGVLFTCMDHFIITTNP